MLRNSDANGAWRVACNQGFYMWKQILIANKEHLQNHAPTVHKTFYVKVSEAVFANFE